MKSKEADLLAREDTSEKVEYDQYTVFAEQTGLLCLVLGNRCNKLCLLCDYLITS